MEPATLGIANKIPKERSIDIDTLLPPSAVNGGFQMACFGSLENWAKSADSMNIAPPIGNTDRLEMRFLNHEENALLPGNASAKNCKGPRSREIIIWT